MDATLTKPAEKRQELPPLPSSDLLGFPPVLDACCGSRMFWFDHGDKRAVFVDKRRETLPADSRQGRRRVVVNPDIVADFTNLRSEERRVGKEC